MLPDQEKQPELRLVEIADGLEISKPGAGERPDSEKLIFAWARQNIGSQYEREGLIDIVRSDRTDYYWGEDAKKYEPSSPYHLWVFKRKTP